MKAYIDCGAYKGTTLRKFRANPHYGPDYKLYAFECNPALSHIDYGPDVTLIRKAIWTTDGELRFYLNTKCPRIEGNSVYRDKTTGHLDKEHPVKVPCIDFSAWLKSTFATGDRVVVKMNVEGAEYDVLEKCVADGTIALISELHIQWHVHKIPAIPRARHEALAVALLKVRTLKVYNGYGTLRVGK